MDNDFSYPPGRLDNNFDVPRVPKSRFNLPSHTIPETASTCSASSQSVLDKSSYAPRGHLERQLFFIYKS